MAGWGPDYQDFHLNVLRCAKPRHSGKKVTKLLQDAGAEVAAPVSAAPTAAAGSSAPLVPKAPPKGKAKAKAKASFAAASANATRRETCFFFKREWTDGFERASFLPFTSEDVL